MDVVAAVIERDGLVLICQRKSGRHALKWEFPGGKIERGESPEAALKRELLEELRIGATIGEEMHRQTVRYGTGLVFQLRFFRVTEFTGEPVNTEFEKIVWERAANLAQYDFLEGDVEFVRLLAGRSMKER
jgi:8-oxo-dGTP diphosphatase